MLATCTNMQFRLLVSCAFKPIVFTADIAQLFVSAWQSTTSTIVRTPNRIHRILACEITGGRAEGPPRGREVPARHPYWNTVQ